MARHPKGKVAKRVINGGLKFKPLRNAHDPIPEGEQPDSPEEMKKLQRYAHVDVESLKEANPDEVENKEENSAQESNAQGKTDASPTTGTSKYANKSGVINSIVAKTSRDQKIGVRDIMMDMNSGNLKGTVPNPDHLIDQVKQHPDDDAGAIEQFNSPKPAALLATYRVLKQASEHYVKAAVVGGLMLAAFPLGAIPAIFALSYLHSKFDEHLTKRGEKEAEENAEKSALTEADKKRKKHEREELIKSKKKSLTSEQFKMWKENYDNWLKLGSTSTRLPSISANPDDEGIVTLISDYDKWFRKIDFNKIDTGYHIKSESASGLRLILSPTLKYFDAIHHKQYLLVCGNNLVGTVNWDMRMGDPHPDIYGWKATLRDGFPESSYHTGRDPDNKYAPYTVIHKGEIKLHNPARMNLDTAFAWAKSIHKGMQDARQEDELESGLEDSEPEL